MPSPTFRSVSNFWSPNKKKREICAITIFSCDFLVNPKNRNGEHKSEQKMGWDDGDNETRVKCHR